MHRTNARKFSVLLIGLPASLLLVLANAHADWQEDIRQQLLSDWANITGPDTDANISFPGVSNQLSLPDCRQPTAINLLKPLQPGRNSIEIRCSDPWWQQNIAIQLHNFRNVAVLTRALNNGEPLTPEAVNWIRQDVGELNQGFFTTPEDIIGQTAKRTLRAGTVLSPDQIQQPMAVARGDKVRIVLRKAVIHLETDGTAQQDGRIGERIRVRNSQSGKTVNAIVVASGEVEIR
ncbi:flagellar basal body P-ring formation chaperone FlgA [Parathalassolituus penaei]|uniref:Flagella basal body P-ring formation protein FlgA n=1 Tax=Parathalassolituus penaei TaxID=2997323 RepID=A0A9X3EE39_9GAMM|nr:flagellar basal body P-ring formation chaperone FlgA [Parathalassolituus penaei]MCY0965912.1 flagellar basal body P-ring formation chaperone FlgA [Parathalassolituus penaei]